MNNKKYYNTLFNGDAVRILNTKQALFYWHDCGIEPLSIYPGEDYKTGEPVIIFVFSKDDTKEAYRQWIENRP